MSKYRIMSVVIVAIAMFSPLHAQIDFELGIAGYYPFNGSANDMTGQGADGIVLEASLTFDRYGNPGAAYRFNGRNSSIRIPHSSSIDFSSTSEYSISLWLSSRDLNSGCVLFKNYDYGVKWDGFSKPLTLYTGSSNGFLSGGTGDFKTDEWYNVVVVQTQSSLKTYINGRLASTVSATHTTTAREEDLFIGKHPYYWGGFEGAIDDICLFSRALTEMEIEALYQIEAMPIRITPQKAAPPIEAGQIAGTWQGVFSQPGNSTISNYAYWLDIKVTGGTISGNSRTEISNTDQYGVMRIKGSINGGSFTIQEDRIVRQYNPGGLDWCLKYGKLRYVPEDQSIRGTWYADNCRENGEIILFKSNRPFNFYKESKADPATVEELIRILSANQTLPQEEKKSVVNRTIELDPITFMSGSATLTASSKSYLSSTLVPFLQEQSSIKVRISGHTDSSGDDGLNLRLSRSRARAVATFLQSNGISASRLSHEGFGEAKPIADNSTSAGRKSNRRVEFQIIAD